MRPLCLSSFLLFVSCQTPVEAECDSGCDEIDTGEVEVVPWAPMVLGHRGSGINEPGNPFAENTLLSIQQALVDGADGVEVDVHQTADGTLVLLHDELLDATTTCGGCVVSYSSTELNACQANAGKWPLIPTLDCTLIVPRNAILKSKLNVFGRVATSTAYVNRQRKR